MYICMYVCMYVCMHVCTYVRMYVRMYVCMYVCMYVYVRYRPEVTSHSLSLLLARVPLELAIYQVESISF